jgi:hypothetical protein
MAFPFDKSRTGEDARPGIVQSTAFNSPAQDAHDVRGYAFRTGSPRSSPSWLHPFRSSRPWSDLRCCLHNKRQHLCRRAGSNLLQNKSWRLCHGSTPLPPSRLPSSSCRNASLDLVHSGSRRGSSRSRSRSPCCLLVSGLEMGNLWTAPRRGQRTLVSERKPCVS